MIGVRVSRPANFYQQHHRAQISKCFDEYGTYDVRHFSNFDRSERINENTFFQGHEEFDQRSRYNFVAISAPVTTFSDNHGDAYTFGRKFAIRVCVASVYILILK